MVYLRYLFLAKRIRSIIQYVRVYIIVFRIKTSTSKDGSTFCIHFYSVLSCHRFSYSFHMRNVLYFKFDIILMHLIRKYAALYLYNFFRFPSSVDWYIILLMLMLRVVRIMWKCMAKSQFYEETTFLIKIWL